MFDDLAKRIVNGEARAAAQLLTLIENSDARARTALKKLYSHTGRAHVVGVTGAAGVGKSVTIDRMTAELRRRQKKVGILAVDPTSPRSGGAILGDRIRMKGHFLDGEVFIRSLATRGQKGGVSAAIWGAIHCLDAMGKEAILVETIGAGQDEVSVADVSHTVVVVITPWSGDDIQKLKGGLLEVANIIVINKCDLPGADMAVRGLAALYADDGRAVLKTSALNNDGIKELVDQVESRGAQVVTGAGDGEVRLNFCRQELLSLLQEEMYREAGKKLKGEAATKILKEVAERHLDPYTAIEKIAKGIRER